MIGMRIAIVLLFVVTACLVSNCDNKPSPQDDPAAALSTFEIEEGFKIELIASEPLIGDPVDMEIDESGKLYVVEMPGYPLDKSGSGSVKLLSDTDGDAIMDKSTTFAENLVLPNSLMRWKKGLLVTDAPHVLYLEDSDGDGRADVRDTLLTGFALSNPQHNLNSPLLGIDNWIYLAHEGEVSTETYKKEFGDTGGEIYYPSRPSAPRLPKNANGRAVRFRPEKGQLEVLSSHTQFGHTFDAWGNYFLVGNANHIYHEVLAQSYLQRNSALLLSDATQSISDHGNAAEVFPTTLNPQHQLLTDVGVITSACGLTAYLGGAFPSTYNENTTFVAEPVSNLIHVDKIKKAGATFAASRIKSHQEFLTSSDAKFRPVNMYVGPDGALYVVDYYRQIIEHPEWMGKEVIESGDLYNDTDKGRIYRISQKNAGPADWTKGIALADANDKDLVARLADPNIWWRQNAQRLLIDRKSKESLDLLNNMLIGPDALGRLHALWTLEGLDQLRPEQIERALQDKEAGIRENAIRLAEFHLSESPALVKSLLDLKSDNDSKVRFQLLCTLGSVNTKSADSARQHILFQDVNDKWVQAAALSASADPTPLLMVVIRKSADNAGQYSSVLSDLAAMIATRQKPETIRRLMNLVDDAKKQNQPDVQAAILEGLAQGLQGSKSPTLLTEAQQRAIVHMFFNDKAPAVRKGALHILQAFSGRNASVFSDARSEALRVATDNKQPEDKRADAIDFIAIQNPHIYSDALMKLFVPQEPLPVQLSALRSLSAIPDTTISHYLLEKWPLLTPQVQDAAIKTFLTSDDRIDILLKAIESDKILPPSISWPRRVMLMAQENEKLRDKSRAIFTENNEQEVTRAYQSVLQLNGDIEKGKLVYQENCALCHQIRESNGIAIGPDLGTIHNWSREAIMAHILAPSLSISSGFDLWSVELSNGENIQGLISSETTGAINLRNVGSTDRIINRNDIRSLKALNVSIMPASLEKQISKQQMADLLAFLKQNK
jgi:putative membrane-bound dehydrogenase-like protein